MRCDLFMIKIVNGKTYHIPDMEIHNSMQMLDISENEAIELWFSDRDIELNEENAEKKNELDLKAKQVKINHNAKSDEKKERKPKEKKVNPIKQRIVAAIAEGLKSLEDIQELTIRNDEKYIDFNISGIEYTINLVAHRAAKQ